jgi:hypothetical protein
MEQLKLLLLEKGDSQKNLVDKVNFNFSQLISFEGGPYGKIGPKGKTGVSGTYGPIGTFGPQGKRGNKWTVLSSPPESPMDGDYWMNPSNGNEIKIYNGFTDSWDLYSLNVIGLDIFREFGPLQTESGPSSKKGYFLSLPSPSSNTLVLSDSYLSGGSDKVNPQYTKMVISTDSSNPERKILEFTKGEYHGTPFNQKTPSFFWTQGPTSSLGNYALSFLSPGSLDFDLDGSFILKSISGSVSFKSGDYSFGSYLINSHINGSYYSESLFGNLNINIDSGSGKFLFQSSNLNLPTPTSDVMAANTTLDIRTSGTTGSQPSLNLYAATSSVGNIYYKMDEVYPSTRSGSTLFKATNSNTDILEISGKGDFKVDKIVYPLHPLEDPTEIIYGPVGLILFSPAISPVSGGTGYNACRGIDYYITPSSSPVSALYLYTPDFIGNTGGWLDLIKENEYMNFRVHSSDPNKGFTNLGIYTSVPNANSPVGVFPNYCTTVEFDIINISKTSTGTSPGKRWFKVLIKAYGGSLTKPFCGELYTTGSTP